MTKTELVAWAIRHKYEFDRFGHGIRKTANGEYRFKVQEKSIRLEVKASCGWVKRSTGFFNQLSLNDQDQLVGMKK